ncbi:DNRLRE domain-containing protein [Paenibacillus rigui]|uniref:Uncharacterized protein n=1 Tax=Paenibacillus rigui TaxID=554312 RepID=A0A229USS6_9BACL|nr:DNRLRE domain-containing protein [Paenibacillus rigui]OXM86452.1 hypothetical protein CF651_09760 [Paenibacillus rigui]
MPSITLYPIADARVSQKYPTSNFGTETYSQVNYEASGTTLSNYVLIQFDLSSIPSGSIINNASLNIYASGISGATGTSYLYADPIKGGSWSETSVTWNTKPFADSGGPTSGSYSGSTTSGTYSWRQLDVQKMVEAWSYSILGNYGIQLSMVNNGSKGMNMPMREQGSSNATYLSINYTPVPGRTIRTLTCNANRGTTVNTSVGGAVSDTQTWYGVPSTIVTAGSIYNPSDEDWTNYSRAYLNFDMSSISGNITKAYLKLAGYRYNNNNGGNLRIGTPSIHWDESIPVSGTVNSVSINNGTDFSLGSTQNSYDFIDITNIFSAIKTAGNGFVIGGTSTTAYYGQNDIEIQTRTSSLPPQLVVITDNTQPNAPVLGFTDGQAINTRTPTITWTYSDPDGNPQGGYFVQVVNSTYTATVYDSGWIHDANARSFTIPAGAIPSDGQWWIRMGVMDSNGAVNQANGTGGGDSSFGNRRIIIDTVAPSYSSVGGNTNGRRTDNPQYVNIASNGTFRVWVNGVGDTTSGINRVQFPSCNATTGSPWSTWYNGTHDGSGNWYCDIPIAAVGNNAEGIYFTDPYIFDNAGNVTGCTRVQTSVDRTAPTISSVQGYSYTNLTAGSRRVWAYGVTDAGSSGLLQVLCNYTVPGSATVNSVTCTASSSDYYVDIPLSAQGEYRVDFYCVDKAGNWMSNPSSKTSYFFVDSQRANDPNPNVTYGTTTATFAWNAFSDPAPSSGYDKTYMYLGEWNGSGWVGTPLYSGASIGNVITLSVSGLKQGARYRYTVTHYDKSGNESAYTYKEFVTKKKIGECHIQKAGQRITLPVYDLASGVNGSKALRTKVSVGIGCFELVPTTSTSASPFRVATPQGIKAISK